MKTNKVNAIVMLVMASAIITLSCNKPARPALGDYPKDANPPGGPLKFYAALDGSAVDSIKANYGVVNNVSFGTGVEGQALQADTTKRGYISFPSANDFGSVSDFTVSFWLNASLAEKNHTNAAAIIAFANPNSFWGNMTIFAEHETSTSDSMLLKIHFNGAGATDNWHVYADKSRLPSMYDGKWHHIAITYQASDSLYTLYRDGRNFDQATTSPAIKFENASQLIISGYQQAAGINGNYNDNSWMFPFGGMIDQIRLYGTTLSASDVTALYNNKQ